MKSTTTSTKVASKPKAVIKALVAKTKSSPTRKVYGPKEKAAEKLSKGKAYYTYVVQTFHLIITTLKPINIIAATEDKPRYRKQSIICEIVGFDIANPTAHIYAKYDKDTLGVQIVDKRGRLVGKREFYMQT